MNITLSQDKLRDGAQRLKTYLTDKNITRNGKPIGANFCQQMLTVGLLDKPLEEVLKLLDGTELVSQDLDAGVLVLSYGSEHVLAYRHTDNDGTQNLKYYTSRALGTDIEISEEELYIQADALAQTRNTTVATIQLPAILTDDWEYEDIIALATAMRYHETSMTLLDILNNTEAKLFINDNHTPYGMSDEWFNGLSDSADELYDEGDPTLDDILKHVIAWMPEYTNDDNELFEFFITVKDLIDATPAEGKPNTWLIPQKDLMGNDYTITVSLYE